MQKNFRLQITHRKKALQLTSEEEIPRRGKLLFEMEIED
jgi:hypothetical protein